MLRSMQQHPATTWHRVLICGGRKYSKRTPIRRTLLRLRERYRSKLIIIVGGAPGADSLAEEICEELNIHCAVVPALWEQRGRAAGPMRNLAMSALDPHEVFAFHENLARSRGTKNMVELA